MKTLTPVASFSAYRTVARNLPSTTLLMFDRQLRYVLAEGDALPILGFSTNRVLGYTLREALPAPEADRFEPLYVQALQGITSHQQLRYGTTTYDVRVLPARDDDGVVFAGMVVCQDVTEARRDADRLRQSEARNRALLQALPDYMIVFGHDGMVIDQSPSASAHFGMYNLMTGVNLRDSTLPVDLIRCLFDLIEATLDEGGLHTRFTLSDHYEPNGAYEVRGVRLNEAQVMVLVRPQTELYLAREALQRRVDELAALRQIEARLADTLDVNAVLDVGFNAAMDISGARDGGLAMYDHSSKLVVKRVVGMTDGDALSVLLQRGVGIAGVAMRDGRAVFTPDVRADRHYHAVVPGTVAQITLPLLSQKKTVGLLVVETDVEGRFNEDTFRVMQLLSARIAVALDHAYLHEQLMRQHDKIAELEKMKTEMMKLGAHDLGSPLMIISHYLQTVRDGVEAAGLTDLLEPIADIQESTDRIRTIANDILNADRTEMLVTGLLMVIVNLTEALDEAMQTARVNAEMKRQVYRRAAWPSEALYGNGDAPLITAAAANLINNAIKYTPEGGDVTVRVWREADRLIFQVEDTGYGIPANMQGRLFQPMQRIQTSETRRISGSGFGLYLVKLIIERHGGEVFFQSVYQRGSTFGFWLPLVSG
ncbi:MAG: ATP-binding protein [Anaerolineae bacterium]|jgi:signal transduction histidine kinase|nr:ATP-binding protein [Anaerolineae bacterium]